MMQSEMQDDAEVALAWLNQILAQMLDDAPWTLAPPDPFASILEINKLRERLESAGLEVPAIVDPNKDPLANMIGWRDFLASIIAVH